MIGFRFFREKFGVAAVDFQYSLCGRRLKSLANAGASGSVFFLSEDDDFIVKTVDSKEADFLVDLLPGEKFKERVKRWPASSFFKNVPVLITLVELKNIFFKFLSTGSYLNNVFEKKNRLLKDLLLKKKSFFKSHRFIILTN